MPQHTNSNNGDPKGDSIDSTDLGTYISTGKGLDYPPLIFTDPKVAANLTDSDARDSETEGPQIDFIGEYCKVCISKWPSCICKPGSDWDNDQNNIITQMDSPSNKDQNNEHPLPSDWSDQENFWNGKTYENSRTP